MRIHKTFLCLFLFLPFHSVSAESVCPSFREIRTKFLESSVVTDAIRSLECRVQANLKDIDSLRFLSDLLWREGRVKESIVYARRIKELGFANKANEMGLHIHKRLSRFNLRAGAVNIQDKGKSSLEIFGGANARYYKRNTIGYSFFRSARSFDGGPTFSDRIHKFNHAMSLGRSAYLIKRFHYSYTANFSPKFKYHIEPHYVIGISDFSLGFTYNDYNTSDTISLKLGVWQELLPKLSNGFFATISLKPERTLSLQNTTEIRWLPRLVSRWTFAGGRTDEGDDVISDFLSADFSLKYYLWVNLSAQIDGGLYNSEVRDEKRVGGQLEFSF